MAGGPFHSSGRFDKFLVNFLLVECLLIQSHLEVDCRV